MVKIIKEEFQPFLRSDLVAFVEKAFYALNPATEYLHNWHVEVICEALQQCSRGKLRRLVINVPPRSLKSHIVSISFVAWLLGRRPATRIVCASYGQELADNLAAACRNIMTADWYRELFPGTRLLGGRQSLHDFTTSANGFRLATSIGGVLTGRGGEYAIIDDPIRPIEAVSERQRKSVNDWFDHTLLTRLNDQPGCIIIVMQRLHEDDLVGHVLAHGDWKLLKFPAIAEENEHHILNTPYGRREFARQLGEALHPERLSLERLAGIREQIGEYQFAAQFQQAPAPAGGGLIKSSWFKRFRSEELPTEFELRFQSWDTANKTSELADYSVCTTWGVVNKRIYLLDVLRERLNYPDLRRTVKQMAESYGARNILIEDRASGTQLIQDLTADGVHGVTRYQPKMEKVMRMHSVTSTIENGFVHIPEQASWLAEYVHEMTIFPNGRFDDQADSTSQALDWVKTRTSRPFRIEVIRVRTRHSSFGSGPFDDGRW
jgi:predicted phage terminase large subunit-like protein